MKTITENRFISMRWLFLSLTLVSSFLLLTACGGSDDKGSTKSAAPPKENTVVAKKSVTLDTSPINIEKVLNPGPIEFTKISECPFLSDKVALNASTKEGFYGKLLKDTPFVRMRVSNKECDWSNVKVFFQPVKNASTLQKRAKKFSHIIKPRKGPGADAAIKYRDAGKKGLIPTTMGFTLGEHYIRIDVDSTYYSTSEKQLQAVADEIAKLLPNAPKIEYQQRTEIKPVDFCKVWKNEVLEELYNIGEKATVSAIESRAGCGFDIYAKDNKGRIDKISLTLSVRKKDPKLSCQRSVDEFGFSKLNDYNNKTVIYKREEAGTFLTEAYGNCFGQGDISVAMTIPHHSSSEDDKKRIRAQYKTQLKPLFENILSRITVK